MLTDKIQKQAITHLESTTECNDWVFSGRSVAARQCKVYQLTSKKFSKDIALKVYHNEQTSRQLKGQYSSLERLSTSMNTTNNKYRTPDTYGSFAEQKFFLMEWISAPSLDNTLWKYFYHRNRQQTAIKETYRWLKQYHQISSPIKEDLDQNFYLEQLKRHIDLYSGEKLSSSNQAFIKGLERITKMSSNFTDLKIDHSNAHGDFTPTNILIGSKNITGIDIGGNRKTPVENDMALMLNYITIDFFNMLTPRQMKKSVNSWSILNIALDAYGYSKDKNQRHFFLHVFLYQTLRRWLIINDRNIKKVRTIDKWRLRNSENIVKGLNKALLESTKT